jgi:hypothetical protein
MSQTFVYDGKEVYLTGRKAAKSSRRGTDKTVYEVKPVKYRDIKNIGDMGIAYWVKMSDLYEIVVDGDEEEVNDG